MSKSLFEWTAFSNQGQHKHTWWVKRRLGSCNANNCMSSTLLGRPCELCKNIFFRILRSLNIRTISQTYEVKTLWVTLFASNAVRWLSHRVSVKKIVNNKLEKKHSKMINYSKLWLHWATGCLLKHCSLRNNQGFTCEKWRHSLLWQKC